MGKVDHKINLLLIPFLLLNYSCRENETIKNIVCSVEKSIDVLPDSTFMSDLRKMQLHDNWIYFIEENSRELIRINSNLTENIRIGSFGLGPGELIDPRNFFLQGDSAFIVDFGSMSIKCFTLENTYVNNLKIKFVSEQRIFAYNNYLYLSSFNKSTKTSLVRFPLTDRHEVTSSEFFGNSFVFDHPFQNIIRNKRDLLKGNEYFYAVSDNLPIIEKYNLKNNDLIQSYDYSFVPVIKNNIRIIESKQHNSNSYTAFIMDSYLYDDAIYLLTSQQGENFKTNLIVKVDLNPDFNLKEIYLLPGKMYTSFCVDESYFYAFNYETSSIEKIKM